MSSRRKQTKPRFLKVDGEMVANEPDEQAEESCTEEAELDVCGNADENPSTRGSIKTEYTTEEIYMDEPDVSTGVISHAEETANGSKYKCKTCQMDFADLAAFMVHKNDGKHCTGMQENTSEDQGPLKVPKMDSSDSESLNCPSFSLGVTDEFPHSCSQCHKSFAKLEHLREHELVHSGEMPYQCEYCQRPFRHKRSCDRHMKLHTGDRHYKCDLCQSAFSRSDHLRNHMKSHNTGKLSWSTKTSCTDSAQFMDINGQESQNKQTAVQLMSAGEYVQLTPERQTAPENGQSLEILVEKPLEYHCTHCAKQSLKQVFASLQALEQHITHMHSGVSLLSCPQCDAAFPTVPTLNDHIDRVHAVELKGPKPSALQSSKVVSNPSETTSNKMFNSSPQHLLGLREHLSRTSTTPLDLSSARSPSRSPPSTSLQCQICSEKFLSREVLTQHIRALHKMKILGSCQLCPEIFTSPHQRLDHLEKHYMKITGSILCKSCDSTFSDSLALQNHQMVEHSRLIYKCLVCADMFTVEKDLKKHLAQDHSTELMVHRCLCCDKACESLSSWRKHMTQEHMSILKDSMKEVNGNRLSPPSPRVEEGHLQCLFCNQTFHMETELTIHVMTHQKTFACNICNEKFQVEFFRDKHMETAHSQHPPSKKSSPSPPSQINGSQSPYWCKICDQLFHSEDVYEEHRLKNHIVRAWPKNGEASPHPVSTVKPKMFSRTCATCGKAFKTCTELEKHSRVHFGPVRLTCVICDVACPSLTDMARHKLQHCKVPFTKPCILCNVEVNHIHEFMEHSSLHVEDDSTVVCCVCKQRLTSKVELVLHSEFHFPKEPQLRCASCKKTCPYRLMLPNSPSYNSQFLLCQECLIARKESTSIAIQPKLMTMQTFASEARSPLPTLSISDTRSPRPPRLSSSGSSPRESIDRFDSRNSSAIAMMRCPECQIKFETIEEFNRHTCVCKACNKCNVKQNIADMVTKFGSYLCKECDFPSDLWRCEKCKITFSREDKYRKHHCVALGEGKPCNICQQLFKHSQLLLRDDKLICKDCNAGLVTCGDCKVTYNTNSKHWCQARCRKCNKTINVEGVTSSTADQGGLCNSCQSETNEKIYQCIKCQKTYFSEEDIKSHVLAAHVNDRTHRCFVCTSHFSTPAKLQCHLIEHDFRFNKNMLCPLCSFLTDDSSELMQHCSTNHSVASRPFSCSSCSQTFFFEMELVNHTHHVHSSKAPKDSESRKRLSASSSSDTEPDAKKLCINGEPASKPNDSDSDDSLFCGLCDQEFGSGDQFNRHVKLIHADSTHACTQCDRVYPSEQDLIEHTLAHHKLPLSVDMTAVNVPITCPLCYQRVRSANYQTHLENDHQELMGKCIMCDFKPTSPVELMKHYLEHKQTAPSTTSNSTATTVI